MAGTLEAEVDTVKTKIMNTTTTTIMATKEIIKKAEITSITLKINGASTEKEMKRKSLLSKNREKNVTKG